MKQKLWKTCKMTPEAFFRSCDPQYQKKVRTDDLHQALVDLELEISERSMTKLIYILDEEQTCFVTVENFYFALEVYHSNTEL